MLLHNFVEQVSGTKHRIDYALTIDAAKELSMVEGNEKGKEARRYFIACEQKLKEIQLKQYNLPQTYLEALKALVVVEEEKQQLALENKVMKPYAEYIPLYFELKDFERNGHADTQLLINPKGKETFRLMWGGVCYEN